MKPAYNSIATIKGAVNGGICSIQIAPREWLNAAPVVDFLTGKITTPITFITGKDWLNIEFIPQSHNYEENEKLSKSGKYFEIKFSGIINYADASLQQVLETMRYNQFIIKLIDRNKKIKIIGLPFSAMLPLLSNKSLNTSFGNQYTEFSFSLNSENAPPFYEI